MNNDIIVCGDSIDGAAVVYKTSELGLTPGLRFDDSSLKWFPRCEIHRYSEGLAVLEERILCGDLYESKASIIDRKGNLIFPQTYKRIDDFSEGRSFAFIENEMDEKCISLLINRQGTILHRYEGLFLTGKFNEGLALLGMIGKGFTVTFGYVNQDGNEVIPLTYHSELDFDDENDICSEDLIKISHLKKCGYIDKRNQVVIPFMYEWGTRFSGGIAAVRKDGRVGFIDTQNHIVLPFEFEKAAAFSDGIACVKKNGKWGFIDMSGTEIITFKYDEILLPHKFVEGEIIFGVNSKKGVMDRYLNVIVPPKYDTLWRIHPGIYHFKLGDLTGVRDRSENELLTDVVWGSKKYPYA